jgi:hypothetical protein
MNIEVQHNIREMDEELGITMGGTSGGRSVTSYANALGLCGLAS